MDKISWIYSVRVLPGSVIILFIVKLFNQTPIEILYSLIE